jgi:hypothetical protein
VCELTDLLEFRNDEYLAKDVMWAQAIENKNFGF